MSQPEPQPLTILLVDDQPEVLLPLAEALSDLAAFTVLTAPDGLRGLEQIATHHVDCMVIDIKMPGMDGYHLIRALRGDPATAETPLIILSALNQSDDQLAGQLSGADQYLTKPVLPTELIAAIHDAMHIPPQERVQRLHALDDQVGE